MNWKQRLGAEAVASFVLAWEAIIVWNGMVPLFGILERVIRKPGPWSQVLGLVGLCVSYYLLLSITMPIARRYNARVNPVLVAYLGGWWLIVLLAALSVQSAAFNYVLGLPVATSGASLVFVTLFVGLAKYWIDGYRNPPSKADNSDAESNEPDNKADTTSSKEQPNQSESSEGSDDRSA